MRDNQDIEAFYLEKEEPIKSCFLALRDIILDYDARFYETRKYGMPCFCIGKKAVVYLWKDKQTDQPYLLLVDGNLIDHPALEQGDRKRMKILRVEPNKDIPIRNVKEVLNLACGIIQTK